MSRHLHLDPLPWLNDFTPNRYPDTECARHFAGPYFHFDPRPNFSQNQEDYS